MKIHVFAALLATVVALPVYKSSAADEPMVGQLVRLSCKPVKPKPGRTIVGEVLQIDESTIQVLDLKAEREEKIRRSEIKELIVNPNDQQVISTLTPAQIFAYRINKSLPRLPLSGKVAAIDGRGIYLTMGKDSAIRVGDELQVYRTGIEIKDPETGEILGKERKLISRLAILEVHDKLSKSKVISEIDIEIQVGDLVEPIVKDRPVAILPAVTEDGIISRGSVKVAEELSSSLIAYDVPIVERSQFFKVLGELNLQQSLLFDEKNSQAFGKQLGAASVLVGRVVPDGKTGASLSLRVVDVESGKVALASTIKLPKFDFSESGDLSEVLSGTNDANVTAPAVGGENIGGKKLFPFKDLRDLRGSTKEGNWERSENNLENLADLSTIALPVQVSGSYSVTFEMMRKSGVEGMFLHFPVGERDVLLGIGHGGPFGGGNKHVLQAVEGESLSRDGTIPNGQWIKVKVDVTKKGKKAQIRATLDKTEIFDWTGDPLDLVAGKRWSPSNKMQLSLSVLRSRMAFRDFNVTGSGAKVIK